MSRKCTPKIFFILGIIVQIIVEIYAVSLGNPAAVRHGATYFFKSAVEDVSLTAHKHKFTEVGLIPGGVTAEEFERSDNQVWDVVTVKPGVYWIVNHQQVLSEVGVIKTDAPFPAKNFIALEHIEGNEFLMKSSINGQCIQYQGKHEKITWAPCDKSLKSHRWMPEFLYEEEKVQS